MKLRKNSSRVPTEEFPVPLKQVGWGFGFGKTRFYRKSETAELLENLEVSPIYPRAQAPITWEVYDRAQERANRWRKRAEDAEAENRNLRKQLKERK